MDYISCSFFFATFLQNIWFVHHDFFSTSLFDSGCVHVHIHVQTAFKFSMSQQEISNRRIKNTFATWLSFNFKQWASQQWNAFLLNFFFSSTNWCSFTYRKLSWYSHTTRHTSLSKTILQGTVEGKRRRGRQRKSWMDNIKEWIDCSFPTLLCSAEDRELWRSLTAQASAMTPWVSEWVSEN